MKKTKTDLKKIAKILKTKVHKTDSGIGEFIRFRSKNVKALLNEDGSGGLYLKVPGLDECFSTSENVYKQIEELEDLIKSYNDLKPDLKKLKHAIKDSVIKVPERENVSGTGRKAARKSVHGSGVGKEKAAAKKGKG